MLWVLVSSFNSLTNHENAKRRKHEKSGGGAGCSLPYAPTAKTAPPLELHDQMLCNYLFL